MKTNLLILTMLFFCFTNSLFAGENNLVGKWTLSEIITNEMITLPKDKISEKAISSDKSEQARIETKTINLRDHLIEEMPLGVTKFIFQSNSFQFYRQSNLTFEGTYTMIENQLKLFFSNKGVKNDKEMKIISIDEHTLIMQSVSMGKSFKAIFTK